jgi:6-phosphogluconolactonase
MRAVTRHLLGLIIAILSTASAVYAQESTSAHGALYTMGNETDGNTVIVFDRALDGRLSPAGRVRTGGLGTGVGLGSQGALALNEEETRLFVVNAGSDDISTLYVNGNALQLIDKVDSGGALPLSLTIDDRILYVLNAESDAISGFRTMLVGLTPIPESTRPLSGTKTDPAQVSFSPDGRTLVVTEKETNNLVLYGVDRWGHPEQTPSIVPSAGETPFGFGFNARRQLIVSEAFDGAEEASAVSSYLLRRDGTLEVVSPSVPTHQTSACWIATTPNRLFAYTTNTDSGTVSGYRVGRDGALTRFDDGGVTANLGADSAPIDMAISPDGRFLYVLNSGNQTVSLLRIHDDGALSMLETTGGLTPGVTGLIVR